MKILFVIPYFYPAEAFGGPVRVAFDVGKELVKRGHEVAVFTSDARDLETRLGVENAEVGGMDAYYFRNLSMLPVRFSKLFITPELVGKMNSEIRSFDILHAHEYTTYQNIVVHKFAKKYGVPYVLQAHGSLPRIGRWGRKWLYDVFFGSNLLKDASKVVALHRVEAEQYKARGVPNERIAVIPNGIDLSEYADLPCKGSFKKKHDIDERIVLYLGRIHRIKGVDILVRAFANVVDKLDDVKLVVVGPDDGYLSELEALIKSLKIEDKVLISGPLYGRDKLEAYVDADVYALPSRCETFPMSLIEAYSCAKPVVCSKILGLKDLVINGVTGLLVEPSDIGQLTNAILYLLNRPKKAEEMGLESRRFVKENLNIEKVVDQITDLYRNAVSQERPEHK